MPITANNTQITFNDNTRQVTAYPTAAVQNRVMRVYEGPSVTANTTGTWPKPTGLKGIQVTVVGGGGRGGRGGAIPTNSSFHGGGAGGTAIKYYPGPSIPGPQPYTAGGSANTSSFGVAPLTVISATGGGAGGINLGTGGVGANGDINIRGDSGGRRANNAAGLYHGGVGGMSSLGGGGASGSNGNNYGGGGGGACSTTSISIPGVPQVAGVGGVGVVIIEEYY